MRSGAVWSEERESKMLPWTGLGGRATTQVPSSCGLPAPGCSIHINHSVITTPSRCAVHNLHNCMSQTLRPVVFILLSWALVPPRYMEGITCRPGWSRHTSFFLHLSIVLSIRIHHYFTPSHINSLSPSQNYLCVWTLGFKQNLSITTLNLSQIFKKISSSWKKAVCLLLPLWHAPPSSISAPAPGPLHLGPQQLSFLDECCYLLHIWNIQINSCSYAFRIFSLEISTLHSCSVSFP